MKGRLVARARIKYEIRDPDGKVVRTGETVSENINSKRKGGENAKFSRGNSSGDSGTCRD